VGLLIRSWNLFHGRTAPPGRRAYLEEMIRLASADQPDILCLQEVPVWAITHLEEWNGMAAVADVACRPWLPGRLAKLVTDLHHGLIRGALTGQANSTLVAPQLRVLEHTRLVLNPRPLVGALPRLPFVPERRICQVIRVELTDKQTLLVGNLHTSTDRAAAEAELMRAAAFLEVVAREDEPVILAGDFNVERGASSFLAQLTSPEWGFSATGDGIDHVLVRGIASEPLQTWPLERRSENGRVLSDHAPVELRIG
jgi:endonuclease/exonuclease/phosphatase family metal-dependent hydrolase